MCVANDPPSQWASNFLEFGRALSIFTFWSKTIRPPATRCSHTGHQEAPLPRPWQPQVARGGWGPADRALPPGNIDLWFRFRAVAAFPAWPCHSLLYTAPPFCYTDSQAAHHVLKNKLKRLLVLFTGARILLDCLSPALCLPPGLKEALLAQAWERSVPAAAPRAQVSQPQAPSSGGRG